jgi:hypothetical protein
VKFAEASLGQKYGYVMVASIALSLLTGAKFAFGLTVNQFVRAWSHGRSSAAALSLIAHHRTPCPPTLRGSSKWNLRPLIQTKGRSPLRAASGRERKSEVSVHLRYRASELDDGVNCTTGGFGCVTEANLDGFVNGEAISNHDVVVWYAGHVTHDVAHEEPGEFGHICGPDLKPVNW